MARRFQGGINFRGGDLASWLRAHPGASMEQVRGGTGYGGKWLAWRIKDLVDSGEVPDISAKGWTPPRAQAVDRQRTVDRAARIRDEVRRGIV